MPSMYPDSDFINLNEIGADGYPWIYPESSESERDRRWSSIRKLMGEHGIDCLVIPGSDGRASVDAANALYVSNFIADFGLCFVVFPLEGEPFLSLEYPRGGQPQQRLPVRYHSWIKNMSASLGQAQGQEVVGYVKRLGLDKSKIGIVNPMLIPAPIYD